MNKDDLIFGHGLSKVFTCGVGVNVLLCPTSANDVGVDVMHDLVNGCGACGVISATEGVISPICQFLAR